MSRQSPKENEQSATDRIYDLVMEILNGKEAHPFEIQGAVDEAIRDWRERRGSHAKSKG